MTRIKICGITNRADALAAAEAGADALGFIGVSGSPRYVDTQQQLEISENLPLFVRRVMVVQRPEDAAEYGTDYVQYYEDTPHWHEAVAFREERIRAFRMQGASTLQEIETYTETVGAIHLDTYHQAMLGGSGETFDWSLAARAKALTGRPVILAGGLTPENIQGALEAVRPNGVDVSSGVEASPGVKDHAKVRAFVRAVREWDLRQP